MFSSPVSPVKHKLGKISISKKKKKLIWIYLWKEKEMHILDPE